MTSKQPPKIATWMLKHFGSGSNNDVLLGDLAEQYHRKDSAMWYWRQAISAIPVSFVREIRAQRIPVGRAFGITLLTMALIAALVSDIDAFWKLGLASALGGVLFGFVMFYRGRGQEEFVGSNPLGDVRIDSSKILIRGGTGAGIVIAVLLSGMLIELPEVRLVAALAILAGLVFGGLLFLWRRHHA